MMIVELWRYLKSSVVVKTCITNIILPCPHPHLLSITLCMCAYTHDYACSQASDWEENKCLVIDFLHISLFYDKTY